MRCGTLLLGALVRQNGTRHAYMPEGSLGPYKCSLVLSRLLKEHEIVASFRMIWNILMSTDALSLSAGAWQAEYIVILRFVLSHRYFTVCPYTASACLSLE